jgi:hypothetical protein
MIKQCRETVCILQVLGNLSFTRNVWNLSAEAEAFKIVGAIRTSVNS